MSGAYNPELLPSLMKMRNTWISNRPDASPISTWDFVRFRADEQLAYAFASIFWPEFIEVEGGVFLAEQFGMASFDGWLREFEGDLSRVEAMINHVHLTDRFPDRAGESEVDVLVLQRVGQVLASCWRAALIEQFPDRSFVVSYDFDESTGDLTGEATFFVDR